VPFLAAGHRVREPMRNRMIKIKSSGADQRLTVVIEKVTCTIQALKQPKIAK
jgi:hypothetical protein